MSFQPKIPVLALAVGLVGAAGLAGNLSAAPSNDLVAHEWGTFTSLQDSDGHSVEGVHHEDEVLPEFVHGRNEVLATHSLTSSLLGSRSGDDPVPTPSPTPYHNPCHGKGCDWLPIAGTALAVTQKMETPVIYFYSKTDQRVKVDVSFPGGIITQYYPNVSAFSPAIGAVREVANGHTSWDVQISQAPLATPAIPFGSIWAPSRQVNSSFVSFNGENEKFIFYRGLGRFDTPLTTPSTLGGGFTIQNPSNEAIPAAFLLQVTTTGGSIQRLGSVPSQGALEVKKAALDSSKLVSMDSFLTQASAALAESLVASGLYQDEALAMVNTWQKSYFRTPGLRVLYVLPREWTDRLLPLQIQPEPNQLIRTLVGRVEVMTRAEEQGLLARLETARVAGGNGQIELQSLGRFAEAKLRRVGQVAASQGASAELQGFVQGLLKVAVDGQ